jgi:malonate transporter and related proteins
VLTSLSVILPVFAVIVIGFIAGRAKLLGPTASSELNKFVVYLGLPALLFQVMAEADWTALWQPGFAASFAIGMFVIFGVTLAYRVMNGRHLTDASIDGLNAGYANTGYIGFPLCELIFGRHTLVFATVATVLTASLLFATAIVFMEIGLQTERRAHHLMRKVALSLLKNPLIVSPIAGALWSLAGLPLPVASTLHLVGGAASPCALVSLGLFLAAARPEARSAVREALALSGLKLIGQPLLTGICAFLVFRLPPTTASVVVLLSALPTGAGSFMIAEHYDREAVVTSKTILFTTIASVLSVTAGLALIQHLQA